MEIRRILYATDFSSASARALDPAVTLARHFGAELEIVHVAERLIDLMPVVAGVPPAQGVPADEYAVEPVQRLDSWVRDNVPPELNARARVEEGEPADRIVSRAREQDVDIIVMGTHGHSAIERFFLGSVTEGVLRKAPCPVLAIPGRPD